MEFRSIIQYVHNLSIELESKKQNMFHISHVLNCSALNNEGNQEVD